jgi:hypothetical protein
MPDAPAAEAPDRHDHVLELRKEASTTALYVAICLLAALIALPETGSAHAHVIRIIWGVTLGLALAHWFAFRVSARLVGAGSVSPEDVQSAGAQLAAAVAVAVLASIPVVLLPESGGARARGIHPGGLHRRGRIRRRPQCGATTARALIYAVSVLVVAVVIAGLKNGLAGH